MKFFKILFFIVGAFFLALWVADWAFRKHLGSDIEQLEVSHNQFNFSAKRDVDGVWQIETKDEESLWFALGYVQSVDREFQLELFRMLAHGRVSEWLGESMLSTDRLNRSISKVAKRIWGTVPDDDIGKRSSIAFVNGLNYFKANTDLAEPLEYLVLQLAREKIDNWEAWEVFALTRFQSWQHSFDLGGDMMAMALNKKLGKQLSAQLNKTFNYSESSLYNLKDLQGGFKSNLGGKAPSPLWSFKPVDSTTKPYSVANNTHGISIDLSYQEPAALGASNLWITKNANSNEAALCNDTHLLFSWPTPLYPIAYNINSEVKGRGFTLPGSPAMVIGNVEHYLKEKVSKSLSWGITLGAFADTQDLVELSDRSVKKSETYTEVFKVKNLNDFSLEEKNIEEQWTKFGPRVDSYLKKYDFSFKKPVALDWIGFRPLRVPTNFFLKRMTKGVEHLYADMAEDWAYPSVNFTWLESNNNELHAGHILTGTIFSNSSRSQQRILSEAQANRRKLSYVSERPYFRKKLSNEKSFLLSTANQSVFKSEALNKSLANIWIPPFRNNQILKNEVQLSKDSSFSQTDYVVPSFQWYWERVSKYNPQDLCSSIANKQLCIDALYGFTRWNFSADKDSWEALLMSLWIEKFKQQFWKNEAIFSNSESTKLYEDWARSYSAMSYFYQLFNSRDLELKIEKILGKSLQVLLQASLNESLALLEEQLGPKKEEWKWGRFHYIKWLHPFAKFPEPLNEMLMSGMLGARRSVSGAMDSPGRFQSTWSPRRSLDFPARHGAVIRFCSKLSSEKPDVKLDWTMPSGVSGKPFSKWAWQMSKKFYK